jgi:hypothetical protein
MKHNGLGFAVSNMDSMLLRMFGSADSPPSAPVSGFMGRARERRAQIERAITAAEEALAEAQQEVVAQRAELEAFDRMLEAMERFGLAENTERGS